MGWKLGYVTSPDEYNVLAEVAKLSEYDGGWALSEGIRDRGAISEETGNSWLSPSVVLMRPLVFSAGKIMSGVESVGDGGETIT
jgi:hypothetical protein